MAHDAERCHYRRLWLCLAIIIALQTVYALIFIWRSSFVVEGRRYFCLFDDAMISMRYARNWAEGLGLVWNPGERVEGYTNFAWTMVMGIVHLLHLSPSHSCLMMQIIGLLTLWLILFATLRLGIALQMETIPIVIGLFLTAFSYHLNYWALLGMETGILTALVTAALSSAVRAIDARTGSIWPIYFLGLALFVRSDAVILFAICAVFLLVFARSKRGKMLIAIGVVLAAQTAHIVWRHAYYGEWLPNTYFLKATGWPLDDRLDIGLSQALNTAASFSLPFLCAGISLLAHFGPGRILALVFFVAQLFYLAYVGGDAWSMDRFVLPSAPAILLLAADGSWWTIVGFFERASRRAIVLSILVPLMLLDINRRRLDEWLFRKPAYMVIDSRHNVRCVVAMDRIGDAKASVAVAGAGAVPYFSGRRAFDFLGKCDKHIARLPVHPEFPLAGHNKFDYFYTLSTYEPDFVVHGLIPQLAYFRENYIPVAVKVDEDDVALGVRLRSSLIHGGRIITYDQGLLIINQMYHPPQR